MTKIANDSRARNAVILLYKQGLSLRNIADKCKVSYETIRQLLPSKIIRKKEVKNVSKDRIQKVYDKCATYQEAADKLGISVQWVHYVVTDKKVEPIKKTIRRRQQDI